MVMLHGIAKKDENVAKLVSKKKELDAKAVAVTVTLNRSSGTNCKYSLYSGTN